MVEQMLGDRYELHNLIGAGGMARVYRAHDRVLHRDVAIKVLSTDAVQDASFVERFKREAHAAAALNSPYAVTIYDWGEVPAAEGSSGEIYYMVMELVDGPNLKQVIRRRGALPEREALTIASEVASALEDAHRRGLVHRDVKPHNILVDPSGHAKVADFGIAHAAGLTDLTTTNAVSGTAHYLSPEQAQGRPIDGRSDVYSLGVVLYEMLTGSVPFNAGTLVDVALQHVQDPPIPPREIRPEISPAAETVVLTALAKDPARRFSSASEMRMAIDAILNPGPRPVPEAIPTLAQAEDTALIPQQRTMRLGPASPGPRPRVRSRDAGRGGRWLAVPVLLLVLALAGGFTVATSHGLFGTGLHGRSIAQRPTTRPASAPQRKPTVKPAARPSPTATPSASPTQRPAAPTATTPPTLPPAPAHVIPAGNGDPAAAVHAFYRLLDAHEFAQAAQLWTAQLRAQDPPSQYIDRRFAGTQSLHLRSVRIVSRSDAQAVVAIDLVEVSDQSTQEWIGTWTLLNSPSGWLLAYPDLSPGGAQRESPPPHKDHGDREKPKPPKHGKHKDH